MSIIICEGCEQQIDTDFKETEFIKDKEYCLACYTDIMSKDFKEKHGSVNNFIDWLTQDYVKTN